MYPTSLIPSKSLCLKKNREKDMVSMDAQSPQGGCCNMRHCLRAGQGQCCLSNSTPCSAAWGEANFILCTTGCPICI